jgi:cyclomaltodextrinase / maltogenic alpha-amylase / neopullulanase
MKRLLNTFIFCFLAVVTGVSQNTSKSALNELRARTAPEWLISGVIYQIQLRAFTPEGTLKAATKRLPKIAELGVTIVYLCPFFVSDEDMDRATWSPRQKASGMNNPRNPYRMKDYYHVDPEYGSDNDLKEFIAESHRLGLRVMLDMVYSQCGPKAVFLKDHPGFIKYDKSGQPVRNVVYNFRDLDFSNPELREYLWSNMEYWIKEFNVDGFRCDSSDLVPLDFWETAREKLELIRPDIGLLAEGSRKEDQIKAFDLSYSFQWFNVLNEMYLKDKSVSILQQKWNNLANERPQGARFIRYIDNHDIANDAWYNRIEKVWGTRGVNAALVMTFTLDGVPFLYNGQEVADTARHSIFGRLPVNWANGNTPEGKSRFIFCQKLCELRRTEFLLSHGSIEWVENTNPDAVLSYLRTLEGEQIITVVNLTKKQVQVKLTGSRIVENNQFKSLIKDRVKGSIQNGFKLQPYGFWVGKLTTKK